ncbi:uncharacterized protein [Pocillopora verrucosa]|uniref:uncharacterized protein n=1 Tax=Pocillopora verrucosa TaxID=203993 RepID=UPI00333E8040
MMSWLSGSSKSQRGDFNVVIYESDYKQLCTWVLKNTDIETGGDLFGLWADKHTAVIQFVVGPGQNCRRSSVSFYQDINYLEKIGEQMTKSEGVCHIGEWHSHHQLGLARPSGGDENTVWNNMPTYNLKRFVIFIANLEQLRKDSYNVNIGCFLFELESVNGKEKQLPVLQGTFKILKNENPLNRKLLIKRDEGAEHDKIEIKMECLKMEISPEGPPQVTYVTKTSSSSGNKRPKTEDESGKKNNKKSRKDARASSVGNENTQGKKNMTPDDLKKGKSTGAEGTHKTATSDSNETNDSHGSQANDPKQGKSTRAEDTHKTATSDSNEPNDSHGSQADDPKQGKSTGAEGTHKTATSDSNEGNDSHGSQPDDPKQGKLTGAEGTQMIATSDSNETNDSHGSQANDPKQGKSTRAEDTHKTATSDSNEGNDSHGSQAENSNGLLTNDEGNAQTSGGEGTNLASDPLPQEKEKDHEDQPGIQLLESKANVTRASHDKTQEGTSNKESNDDKRNVNISEVEGENSTDDQQLPEKDQEHETQPNSRKPEGDANDHNASHDRTEEGKSSKVSNKDGGKAKIEGEKSADNAEPPGKDSNKAFNSLDQDQTSRSNKNVSGQGETPMKDKQTKSRSQRSDRGANKQVKPHDSDKDKLREGQKNDASKAGSSQPTPGKSSKATKATPKSKSGTPPSSSVPGKAVPVKPAGKEAMKKVEEKGGIGKKGGPTKYMNKKPSK